MAETDRIDELYKLPLDEFTPARDALAAELRSAGDRDGAARVKKLRKPSLSAWAVNQVAHAEPQKMGELFALRDKLEDVSDAKTLRQVSEDRRHLIAELVKRAEGVLKEAGRGTSATTLQAITQTLHAGDTEEDREQLERGRLSGDLEPSGFGGFSLGPSDAFSSSDDDHEEPAPDPKLEAKRRRAEELTAEAEEAEAEAERAEAAVVAAENELKRARAQAATARKSAEQTRDHADRAEAEVRRLSK